MSAAKRAVLNQASAEMALFGDRPIVLELSIGQAVLFCGALQLALRHPQFSEKPSAREVREFITAIKDQVPAENVGIRKLIELGFHPRFDT